MGDTSLYDQKLLECTRKRDVDKLNFLQSLDKKILKSQLERILKNDKTVWGELFLPKWMTWEMLKSWSAKYEKPETICVFCGSDAEGGKKVRGKIVCQNCIVEIKAE